MGNFWAEAADQLTKRAFGPRATFWPSRTTGTPQRSPLEVDNLPRVNLDDYEFKLPEPEPSYPRGIGGSEAEGLDLATKAIFGPKARFWPEFSKPAAAASESQSTGIPGQRTAGIPFKPESGDDASNPYSPGGMADFGTSLSSILDLRQVKKDQEAAAAGDADAKARLRAMQNSPAVTSLGEPKAKPRPGMGQLPSARDLTSEGLSPAALPAARDLSGEGMMLSSLPAPKPVGAQPGGGGVEVPEQEQRPRDLSGLGIIGDTLINVGNALSDARPIATGGFLEQRMDQLRQEQMQGLKMRHDMWSDAYTQAQQLPSEVLTDPSFGSLAQAKAALEKDMMDGKIDNEKNVSGFLTEMARHKSKLDQILATSKGQQAAATQEATLEAQGTLRAQREAEAAAGDPRAQAILAMLGPTAKQKFDAEEAERKANQDYRLSALAQQGADRDEDRALRQANMNLYAQSRGDALDFQRNRAAVGGLQTAMEHTRMMYGKPDEDGQITDPATANAKMWEIHAPEIMALAQERGIRVVPGPDGKVISINGRPYNAAAAPQIVLAMLRGYGGGE